MGEFLREIEFYEDVRGRSEVKDAIRAITKSDPRGARAIDIRLVMLRQLPFTSALESGLIKKATPTIYVLRVQSGPVSFRLPFFEPLCRGGKLVVLTACEYRSVLRRDRYKALIESAERRREDWIRRFCKPGNDDSRKRVLREPRG
jgi:hypothetical protein